MSPIEGIVSEKDLGQAIELMKELLPDIKGNIADISVLKTEINHLQKAAEKITGVIFEGNGRPGLTQQLMDLSNRIAGLEKVLAKMQQNDGEMRRLRWETYGAIVVALIAAMASYFT